MALWSWFVSTWVIPVLDAARVAVRGRPASFGICRVVPGASDHTGIPSVTSTGDTLRCLHLSRCYAKCRRCVSCVSMGVRRRLSASHLPFDFDAAGVEVVAAFEPAAAAMADRDAFDHEAHDFLACSHRQLRPSLRECA